VLGAPAASAQVPDDLLDRRPKVLAQEVFNSAYGRLLAAEFGKVLRESARPECLAEKGLRPEQLEARGRELLITSGSLMLELGLGMVDGRKLEDAFLARAGRTARGELAQLRGDIDVKKYLKLSDPAKLARLADSIVEAVERHALLARAGLARQASPLATGNEALLRASPEEKSLEETDRFVKASTSERLRRWLEIQVALAEAYREATDTERMLRYGPVQLTPNVGSDLLKLCVFPK